MGDKESYFVQVERVLAAHPGLPFVGAHFGGYPERLEYIAELMEAHPQFRVDTSATKWIVRELSRRPDAARDFALRFADRILFGTDLVVMFGGEYDYFTSRMHVQRGLWEGAETIPSMIRDPDATGPDFPDGPRVAGLALPPDVLRKIYRDNALELLEK